MEISKNKINIFSRLGHRKQREKLGLFIAEGSKCVADTMDFFDVEAIVVLDPANTDIAGYSGKTVLTANEHDMRKISQLQTLPDVVAIYRMPAEENLDSGLISGSLTLMLDAVQDPGNLGTILRIASWFGIRQVILGMGCADPYNPKAVQASMGAIGMIKIVHADLTQVLTSHPDIPVYGTLLDGENIYEAELALPAFVVMGNEGNGINDDIRKLVNRPLLIPSFATGPHAESLNVAAATAVTVSEFCRRSVCKI